jgi:hypothetical protein
MMCYIIIYIHYIKFGLPEQNLIVFYFFFVAKIAFSKLICKISASFFKNILFEG